MSFHELEYLIWFCVFCRDWLHRNSSCRPYLKLVVEASVWLRREGERSENWRGRKCRFLLVTPGAREMVAVSRQYGASPQPRRRERWETWQHLPLHTAIIDVNCNVWPRLYKSSHDMKSGQETEIIWGNQTEILIDWGLDWWPRMFSLETSTFHQLNIGRETKKEEFHVPSAKRNPVRFHLQLTDCLQEPGPNDSQADNNNSKL